MTALRFNGSTDEVISGAPISFDTSLFGYTFSAWVKVEQFNSSGHNFIVGQFPNIGIDVKGDGSLGAWLNGSSNGTSITEKVVKGRWFHVAAVYTANSTAQQRRFFLNGVFVGYDTDSGSGNVSGSLTIHAGDSSNWGSYSTAHQGSIDEARIWETAFTDQQIADLYYSDIVPAAAKQLEWLFDEGAGPTANDTSGNGNNGTITGATYVDDVPMKKRPLVGGNLVKNGDFEFAPPFVAATGNGWIDGTAAGSPNNIFHWYTTGGGSHSGQFDNSIAHSGAQSLKISTTATGSYNETRGNNTGYFSADPGIPLRPNTLYNITFWMKTNYVSGDSNNGAFVTFMTNNGTGSAAGEVSSVDVKTTTDWTKYTLSFTTASNAVNGHFELRIYGHTGTGTLIMDAWFDDITLYPVPNTTRLLA